MGYSMEDSNRPCCDPRWVLVLKGSQAHPHICRIQQITRCELELSKGKDYGSRHGVDGPVRQLCMTDNPFYRHFLNRISQGDV